jgi:predicted nucleotidyltransferase
VFSVLSRVDMPVRTTSTSWCGFNPKRSLLDQVAFQQELEELLGRPVDVVVEGGLNPYLEQQILAEAVPL